MLLKIGIFEVVVVVARAIQCKWHHPWCGDDTYPLGWGVGMHQAILWVKAADHHVASGIKFSSATGVNFLT